MQTKSASLLPCYLTPVWRIHSHLNQSRPFSYDLNVGSIFTLSSFPTSITPRADRTLFTKTAVPETYLSCSHHSQYLAVSNETFPNVWLQQQCCTFILQKGSNIRLQTIWRTFVRPSADAEMLPRLSLGRFPQVLLLDAVWFELLTSL